jgi:hypothetical protein
MDTDVHFKACGLCKKNYCKDCGNKSANFFGQSSIKCIYIMNKCFSCCVPVKNENDCECNNSNLKEHEDSEILEYVLQRIRKSKKDIINDMQEEKI